jgi:hypothetical protein
MGVSFNARPQAIGASSISPAGLAPMGQVQNSAMASRVSVMGDIHRGLEEGIHAAL